MRDRLYESAKRHGILAPIFIDTDPSPPKILDGHHRVEISKELGIPTPYITWPENLLPELRQELAKRFRVMGEKLYELERAVENLRARIRIQDQERDALNQTIDALNRTVSRVTQERDTLRETKYELEGRLRGLEK